MNTATNRAQNVSGICRGVFDQVLVSKPLAKGGFTRKPLDIFSCFLRNPEQVATWDEGKWSQISDDVVPGLHSLLRFLKLRARRSIWIPDAGPFTNVARRGMRGVDGERGERGAKGRSAAWLVDQPLIFSKRGRSGQTGRGIVDARLDDEAHLIIRFSDNTEWRSEQTLRGADGRGIQSASVDEEGFLHLRYTDDTEFTSTTSLIGPQGVEGPPGAASTVPGPQGIPGVAGRPGVGINSIELTNEGYLNIWLTNLSLWSSAPRSIIGPPGRDGKDGSSTGQPGPRGRTGFGIYEKDTQLISLRRLTKQQRYVTNLVDNSLQILQRQQLVQKHVSSQVIQPQQFYLTSRKVIQHKKTAVHVERPVQVLCGPSATRLRRLELQMQELANAVAALNPNVGRLLVLTPNVVQVSGSARVYLEG